MISLFVFELQVIINGDIDYSDVEVQNAMDDLLQELEADKMIGSDFYTDSWLRQFLSFVKNNADYLEIDISNKQNFIDALRKV